MALKDFLQSLGKFLFDERCIGCGHDNGPLCPACRKKMVRVQNPCQTCGRPTRVEDTIVTTCSDCKNRTLYFQQARSLFHYAEPVNELIKRVKFRHQFALVKEIEPEWQAFGKAALLPHLLSGPPILTWVPGQQDRAMDRAILFSQTLAESLGKALNYPAISLLEKVRATPPQMVLDFKKRTTNLKDAFRSIREPLQSESWSGTVVLVDDLYTTGHTVMECSKTLKKAGAKRVLVLTLARTVLAYS